MSDDVIRCLEISKNVSKYLFKETKNVKMTLPQVSLTQIVTNIFSKYPSVVC